MLLFWCQSKNSQYKDNVNRVTVYVGHGLPKWLSRWRTHLQCRIGKITWRRAWKATPVFLLGEFHGQRSLLGYSPQGRKELDKTEVTDHARTQYYFSAHISNSIDFFTVPCQATMDLMGMSPVRKRSISIFGRWLLSYLLQYEEKAITYPTGVEESMGDQLDFKCAFKQPFCFSPFASLPLLLFRDIRCLSRVLKLELGCFSLVFALKAWVWIFLLC